MDLTAVDHEKRVPTGVFEDDPIFGLCAFGDFSVSFTDIIYSEALGAGKKTSADHRNWGSDKLF